MSREDLVARIREALGRRKLVWFGIRGQDAASLLAFEQFQACYSLTAPIGAASLDADVSLEELTGVRVDLDRYDIDLDRREVVSHLRRMMLATLNTDSVLCTYRPCYLVSNVHFACSETAQMLGMFKERQMPFEHKPWVETNLRDIGVRIIPWRYVAEERLHDLTRLLDQGPIVLRSSRSPGGTGVSLVRHADEIDSRWEPSPDSLIAVAPYLSEAAPLNVGAVVFPDGTVTVHPASYQLIGVPECTTRDFGYCGNDIGLFKRLPDHIVDQVDTMTRTVGAWMGRMGYVGSFGLDLLVQGEDVYFGEVNPRFQGSTAFTTAVCAELDQPDILLDHLAAFLGIGPDPEAARLTLRDWNSLLPDRAQVILHNLSAEEQMLTNPLGLIPPLGSPLTTELVPLGESRVAPGAILCRAVVNGVATPDGYALDSAHRAQVATMVRAFTGARREDQ